MHTQRPASKISPQHEFLIHEAGALLTRLIAVKPFELTMPMVAAASLSDASRKGIHLLIKKGRQQLRQKVLQFIHVMKQSAGTPLHQCQAAYAVLKLQFNALLDQFDIFADVVNQRSEHKTGVWLGGLDVFARDVLILDDNYYHPPPLVCYLDRGHGAAIRRARTRLPGGKENPVAVIKIPRERMVGSGIGSSLVHEVGHQGAALLGLIPSLKPLLSAKAQVEPLRASAWRLYDLWISEILSDFWAVAMLGVSASTGLLNVVSLPAYFVFRMPDGDPHPFPWIRMKISLAFGKALYPDPQWSALEQLWEQLYPLDAGTVKPAQRGLVRMLEETLPDFVRLILDHRPGPLKGKAVREVFPIAGRQPAKLRELYQLWIKRPDAIYKARPALVFATIGQARVDRAISPFEENRLLSKVLWQWALMKT